MLKHRCPRIIFSSLILFGICRVASAESPIIRPYQNVRSAGMGGLTITTGLYDENFFGNPARVTANPESKLTLFQMTPFEANADTISIASTAAGGASNQTIANDALGKNFHARFQLVLPAYYLAATEDRRLALAVGLIASVQADAMIEPSYSGNANGYVDAGPAVTVGYRLLEDKSLSVGLTGHFIYRLDALPNTGLLDYLGRKTYSLSSEGGAGGMINFDLGAMYRVTTLGDFDVNLGAAVQNVLGGVYSIPLAVGGIKAGATNQPRSFGGGVSLSRHTWGFLDEAIFALEVRDFGNNQDGSFYKLLHLGTEMRWKSIALRLGLNQGYWAAGLGFDFHYFTMDLASYGEELGLNTGSMEDRRYTMNFGIHI